MAQAVNGLHAKIYDDLQNDKRLLRYFVRFTLLPPRRGMSIYLQVSINKNAPHACGAHFYVCFTAMLCLLLQPGCSHFQSSSFNDDFSGYCIDRDYYISIHHPLLIRLANNESPNW